MSAISALMCVCFCLPQCSFYQDCCSNACDFCENGCIADLECDASSETLMKLTINPDQFPEEISFQILDTTSSETGIVLLQGAYTGVPVQVESDGRRLWFLSFVFLNTIVVKPRGKESGAVII